MIHYEHGSWGLCFLWQLRGSTLPKGLIWALPWSAISGYLCYLRSEAGVDIERIDAATLLGAYGFFISLLAFMVAFRNNQGWSRYWEGATLLQQTRGEWFNAVSSVFAFCNPQPDVKEKVNRFQGLIVRLMSLLFCSAVTSVSDLDDFEVIDMKSLNPESLRFLLTDFHNNHQTRCEILVQWIQRAIVQGHNDQTISIPAPILSRTFQELSRGIVNIQNARKINDLPYPFHCAQLLTVMLIVYTVGISVGSAYVFELWISSALVTLLNVFSLWCVNYGAVEMEHPFCSGNHGLPLHREVRNMNECLLVLMLDQTQTVPSMSNASKLVSELIETSPITDHLPSHEKTNGVEKETFFSTGVKRSRSRNLASLYNLQLTVEGDCNGEADEAAILGTHRQAPK